MAPNPRVTKAFSAMSALGISHDDVEPVLQKLLRVYEQNWELIEEDNYRTLIDAYFELKEDKVTLLDIFCLFGHLNFLLSILLANILFGLVIISFVLYMLSGYELISKLSIINFQLSLISSSESTLSALFPFTVLFMCKFCGLYLFVLFQTGKRGYEKSPNQSSWWRKTN